MEMSITRALSELKLLDSRINRVISNLQLVASNKKSAKNVDSFCTIQTFEENAKSDYQSVIDLIERKKKIKSAIVESNANTIAEIANIKMTVADIIERKNNIEYEKTLLRVMKSQLNSAKANTNARNESVDRKLDEILVTMLGREGAKNADKSTNEFSVKYKEDNEYEILDPLSIEVKIKDLEEKIENFENEVDFVLSESNTITKIVIED